MTDGDTVSRKETEMSETRKQLIVGLVGERGKLYNENAHFYHTVNALADLLPAWVDGIAAQAESISVQLERQIEALRRSPQFDNGDEYVVGKHGPAPYPKDRRKDQWA